MKLSFTTILATIFLIVIVGYTGIIVVLDQLIQKLQVCEIVSNADNNISYLERHVIHGDDNSQLLRSLNLLDIAQSKKSTQDIVAMRRAIAESSLIQAEYFLFLYQNTDFSKTNEKEIILNCLNSYKITTLHQHYKMPPPVFKLIKDLARYDSLSARSHEFDKTLLELMHLLTAEIPKLRTAFAKRIKS